MLDLCRVLFYLGTERFEPHFSGYNSSAEAGVSETSTMNGPHWSFKNHNLNKNKAEKLRTFLKGFSPEKARQPCVVERPEEVKLRLVKHSCCRCRLTPVPNDNTALSGQAKWSTRFGYGSPFDTMFCENTILLLMFVWDFCDWTYTEAISFTGDCWPYFHGKCPPFISMMIYHIRPYTNQSHHVKEKDDSGSHISAQTMYRPNYVCSGKSMLTQWLEAVGTMTAVKR